MNSNVAWHTVGSFAEFLTCMAHYPPGKGWVYRGQPTKAEPTPKVGRQDFTGGVHRQVNIGSIPDYDLELFNEWRKQAVAYAGDKLPESLLECLAYAQHYGLATRLLDWSVKPLVALFFAVEESGPLPGVVYCHAQMNVLDGESKKLPNVFGFYRPRPFDRRILAQGGAFTYHPDPMAAFPVVEAASMYESDPKRFWNLVALEIPAHVKPAILSQLCDLGVTRVALFPDLDGLSSFINWGARVEAAELRKHFSNGGV